jgi:Helix-turn-helix domain
VPRACESGPRAEDKAMPNITHHPVTLDDLVAQGRNFAVPWEVASIFRCDPRTVRRQCREGGIPSLKVGAEYRIPVAWLRQAAATAGQAAGGAA